MNERDELAERYFGIIQKMVKNKCDMCNKLLTTSGHDSCCSDCWEENAAYYE